VLLSEEKCGKQRYTGDGLQGFHPSDYIYLTGRFAQVHCFIGTKGGESGPPEPVCNRSCGL
jgi:hypothetical protein